MKATGSAAATVDTWQAAGWQLAETLGHSLGGAERSIMLLLERILDDVVQGAMLRELGQAVAGIERGCGQVGGHCLQAVMRVGGLWHSCLGAVRMCSLNEWNPSKKAGGWKTFAHWVRAHTHGCTWAWGAVGLRLLSAHKLAHLGLGGLMRAEATGEHESSNGALGLW